MLLAVTYNRASIYVFLFAGYVFREGNESDNCGVQMNETCKNCDNSSRAAAVRRLPVSCPFLQTCRFLLTTVDLYSICWEECGGILYLYDFFPSDRKSALIKYIFSCVTKGKKTE